jgi:YHS domain-containing protein
MKTLLIALALAATPALAHGKTDKAEAAKHKDAPRSFDHKPTQGTWARCPVSGDVFQVDADTQFYTYEGRTYAFCCPDCPDDFIKNPAKYADKKNP